MSGEARVVQPCFEELCNPNYNATVTAVGIGFIYSVYLIRFVLINRNSNLNTLTLYGHFPPGVKHFKDGDVRTLHCLDHYNRPLLYMHVSGRAYCIRES